MVCYDEDDPYLVVAADKGTATFSDIANAISLEYGFWLGDAFASGGSVGYDHKKMGITAKGAWESVKRHFYEMNRDSQNEDFTVLALAIWLGMCLVMACCYQGISSWSLLLTMFIFLLIPIQIQKLCFKERERLFNLPRSKLD